jgi:hypothetical protein
MVKINLLPNKDYLFGTIISCILLFQTSCKKLVEINVPPTQISSDNVYSDDATAISVLTGIYTNMSSNAFAFVTGINSISIKSGLSADELTLFGGSTNSNTELLRFYQNSLTNSDAHPWQDIFKALLPINSALEKLDNSKLLSPAVRQQLIGEAKFLRAFCYFYLVNLYGDVPLVLTSDYRINNNLVRATTSDIYKQIVADLKDAQAQLSDTYLDASLGKTTPERVRPTKWAASALLARVYLYKGDWANAEIEASSIISNNSTFALSGLDNTFLKASLGNKEAIWQLQPVNSGWNTEDAKVFVLNTSFSAAKPVFLSSSLLNSFDTLDKRRTIWIKDTVFAGVKYSYAAKYKIATSGSPVNEYLMVLRLGEQYLIRAEAEANGAGGGINAAIADLNKIRNRAGLGDYSGPTDKNSVFAAILHERQVELFTEWGHRWLDLKRTNNVDAVMSIVTPLKGGMWSPNWALYPISYYDLTQDPDLTQNPGY